VSTEPPSIELPIIDLLAVRVCGLGDAPAVQQTVEGQRRSPRLRGSVGHPASLASELPAAVICRLTKARPDVLASPLMLRTVLPGFTAVCAAAAVAAACVGLVEPGSVTDRVLPLPRRCSFPVALVTVMRACRRYQASEPFSLPARALLLVVLVPTQASYQLCLWPWDLCQEGTCGRWAQVVCGEAVMGGWWCAMRSSAPATSDL
jgi:hypothetical protein